MKVYHWVASAIGTVAILLILCISSVELVIYGTPHYFQNEYEKYEIAQHMEMTTEDLLTVTEDMMQYLRGNRENLIIQTTVAGQSREFFNQREKDHMADVKNLFVGALSLRMGCIGYLVCLVVYLWKQKKLRVLLRSFQVGGILFLGITGVLTWLISLDFFRAFQIFHHIFFRNTLWILDPNTDLLINIVPQPFFVDTAVRIGIFLTIGVLGVWGICTYLLHGKK